MIYDTYLYTNTYDMYKKDGKYLPTKITVESFAKLLVSNKPAIGKDNFEFVFSKHQFSDKKGLSTKINLNKLDKKSDLDSSTSTLLSTEEQAFIDEK
jgi:hypothetical protein